MRLMLLVTSVWSRSTRCWVSNVYHWFWTVYIRRGTICSLLHWNIVAYLCEMSRTVKLLTILLLIHGWFQPSSVTYLLPYVCMPALHTFLYPIAVAYTRHSILRSTTHLCSLAVKLSDISSWRWRLSATLLVLTANIFTSATEAESYDFWYLWFLLLGRQIFHKWAVLTETDDVFSETRGYLLCDLYVMDKESAKIVPEHRDNINEIEK